MNNTHNRLDNLEIVEKFLEIYNLTRLNHEDTENLNGTITSNHKLPNNKNSRTNGFKGEFYQPFKILMPNLVKIL